MGNTVKNRMSARKVAHYIYFSMLIVVIMAFYAVSLFLYRNFYMAITQSDIIIILKRDLATETFDINKFDAIIEKLGKKTETHQATQTKSPF